MSKHYLITGGARGIGLGIARRLASDGARISIGDLNADTAAEAAATLPGAHHQGFAMDVTDAASVAAGYDMAEAAAPLDGVICNAGILLLKEGGERTPIIDTELDEWQRTHDVNLTGTFLTVREFLRRRRAAPVSNARIVTFTSSAAQLGGYRSSSSYISSKSGVIGLTKAVARECAADGITCNAVAPGMIDAPMLRLSMAPGSEAAASANIPLGRIGTPEDVAGAVAFLLSPDSSYMTGGVLDVNGGFRMQ
ncbi:MAG: SDR family NAD(P)-dependent oxidoreductase [Pseudomonadota bacterium]|nr:SDR family NAD(P)-dependent oxidoreductase [Pseudomonadota bacterium]